MTIEAPTGYTSVPVENTYGGTRVVKIPAGKNVVDVVAFAKFGAPELKVGQIVRFAGKNHEGVGFEATYGIVKVDEKYAYFYSASREGLGKMPKKRAVEVFDSNHVSLWAAE